MSTIADPISPARPTGIDLREDAERRPLYYAIKDARSNARAAERAMLNGSGDGDGQMRLPPQWSEVRTLARDALESHSKDIEIVCWLIEAEARLSGVEGLGAAFADAHQLVVAHWDGLYSIDTDTTADKVAPFAGLNGAGAEGTLIQPLRFMPLIPGAPLYAYGLWAYETAQRDASGDTRTRLRVEVDAAGTAAMAAHLAAVEDAARAWTLLSGALDAVCGDDAPPSSRVRNVLAEMAAAIRDLAGLAGDVVPAAAALSPAAAPAAAPADAPVAPADQPAATAANIIATRDDAFNELLRIAAFFRRTEPHSPMSLAIETLVRRGRMDFVALLEELVPDEHARTQVLTMAGIKVRPRE